ncbi:MAG: copper resistance protein CopC [Chloroflexota bacterium]|nr:copper resistance protein CopC [Chloroflexota bacterium]
MPTFLSAVRRARRGLLTVVLLAAPSVPLLAGTTTIAHASARYVSSTPEKGGFLTAAPSNVRITFDEEVTMPGSNISVVALGGAEVNGGPVSVDPSDHTTLVVPLKSGLANGLYTVNWVSMSSKDGSSQKDAFNFGLRTGAAPPVMHLDRQSVDMGQMLGITGSGYKPNGSIVVSAGDDDEFVDVGKSDAAGTFHGTVVLPADLPLGTQTVTVADGDGAKATSDLQVKWGGWPPLKVTVAADTAKDDVTFKVNLFNRSDYHLMVDATRVRLPEGTTYKSADSYGRLNSAGEATWDSIDLPPHGSTGPLTLVVDTTKLKDGSSVMGQVWAQFSHSQEAASDGTLLPAFVSSAVSKPATVRSGGLH